MKKVTLYAVLVSFLILTGLAVYYHGAIGIFTNAFQNYATAQVFIDLVIALMLFIVWLWKDTKAANRNPWPWIIAIFGTGSIAALIYLIVYKSNNNK